MSPPLKTPPCPSPRRPFSETEEHPALEAHLFLPSWPAALACILFVGVVLFLSAIGAACLISGHHG